MAKCDMAQLMRNHTGQFFGTDVTCFKFVVKSTGYKNAPIRGGQAIHRVNLIDMYLDARQIEGGGQFVAHVLERGVHQRR